MTSNPIQTYGWYPTVNGGESLQQRECRITRDWFSQNLSAPAQALWRRFLQGWQTTTGTETLARICRQDSAELVELLYSRFPDLFHNARRYTLSPELFAVLWEDGPYSEELLLQCCHARTAHLDAACLFALCGAVSCLEMLLEHGADPDGLENPDGWSYIELPNSRILPVTPMDCALLSDHEDCQFVLEMYGGKPLHEHLEERRRAGVSAQSPCGNPT